MKKFQKRALVAMVSATAFFAGSASAGLKHNIPHPFAKGGSFHKAGHATPPGAQAISKTSKAKSHTSSSISKTSKTKSHTSSSKTEPPFYKANVPIKRKDMAKLLKHLNVSDSVDSGLREAYFSGKYDNVSEASDSDEDEFISRKSQVSDDGSQSSKMQSSKTQPPTKHHASVLPAHLVKVIAALKGSDLNNPNNRQIAEEKELKLALSIPEKLSDNLFDPKFEELLAANIKITIEKNKNTQQPEVTNTEVIANGNHHVVKIGNKLYLTRGIEYDQKGETYLKIEYMAISNSDLGNLLEDETLQNMGTEQGKSAKSVLKGVEAGQDTYELDEDTVKEKFIDAIEDNAKYALESSFLLHPTTLEVLTNKDKKPTRGIYSDAARYEAKMTEFALEESNATIQELQDELKEQQELRTKEMTAYDNLDDKFNQLTDERGKLDQQIQDQQYRIAKQAAALHKHRAKERYVLDIDGNNNFKDDGARGLDIDEATLRDKTKNNVGGGKSGYYSDEN